MLGMKNAAGKPGERVGLNDYYAMVADEKRQHEADMVNDAPFAKKVTLPDGTLGILVGGEVIKVEPQTAVAWLVAALRRGQPSPSVSDVAAAQTGEAAK